MHRGRVSSVRCSPCNQLVIGERGELIVHGRFSWIRPKSGTHFSYSCFIGQNSVTWPHLTAKEDGKCGLVHPREEKNGSGGTHCLCNCVGVCSDVTDSFCDPMDSSVRDFPRKTIGVGCHFLLQGIFPTQGSNLHLLGLLLCRQILYRQHHLASVTTHCKTNAEHYFHFLLFFF